MIGVVKQKVRSALCDEDKVDYFNKSMYKGSRVVYNKDGGQVEI